MAAKAVRFLGGGVAIVCAVMPGQAVFADGLVPVRSGDHPGFGRIVIDTSGDTRFKIEQSGSRVFVRLAEPASLERAPAAPHNVLSLRTSGPVVEFTIMPGATVHSSVIDGHIVVDVNDPPPLDAASAPPPAASTPAAASTAVVPAPAAPAPTPAASMPAAPTTKTAATAPVPAAPTTAQPATKPAAPGPTPAVTAAKTAVADTPDAKKRKPGAAPIAQTAMVRSPELAGRAPIVAPPAVQPAPPAAALPPASPGTDDRVVAAQPLPAPGSDAASPGSAPSQSGPAQVRGPLDLLARPARLPQGGEGAAFILPFAATTGAAAFQRDQEVFVVFDERRPVDLSSLRDDPVFNRAEVRMLAGGTLLRLPMPGGLLVSLTQSQSGWRITGSKAPPKAQTIAAIYSEGNITLPAEQPTGVVTMADPDSGATLLVGTTRRAGQAVGLPRRSADFILRATNLGVVVEPLSDALTLKVAATGFIMGQPSAGLSISPSAIGTGAMADALSLTRRLDFHSAATDLLLRRLTGQINEAAMAPSQARGPKRVAAAVSMISLGMAAEAQSLLRVAAEADPRLAASPDVAALGAVASLLAGRTTEADDLNDPRLNGSDDIAFWRAIRQAMLEEGSPVAATVFATTAPLISLYPKAIRDRVLPLVAETMIQGGEPAAASRLLSDYKDEPKLAYARALLMLKDGDIDKSLGLLDQLVTGRDQFDRARAAMLAVELRLAAKRMTPSEAADTMDRMAYAWRGDQRELALRQRIAELREQTGEWRVALATLRQAEADFPEQAKQVHSRLQDAFADMVSDPRLKTMPPIDVVSTIEDNADLGGARQGDERMQEQLADRLLALDLPGRAGPVLDKLMRSATTPLSKALYGANLAALSAREKNDAAALVALDASEAPNLPPDLAERRTLLRAESLAHAGNTRAAETLLAGLGTPAANQSRAAILEQAQDWIGAERAWADYAAKSLPDEGTLDDDQARTLVRLATAAARAGDDAALSGLRDKYGDRLSDGALADMFRLLTAEPVRGTSDLQRVRQDISLAQSLPANLRALYGTPGSPKN